MSTFDYAVLPTKSDVSMISNYTSLSIAVLLASIVGCANNANNGQGSSQSRGTMVSSENGSGNLSSGKVSARTFELLKEVNVGRDEEKTHWFVLYPPPYQIIRRPLNLDYDPSQDKQTRMNYVLKYHKLEDGKEVVYIQTNNGPWYLKSEDGQTQAEMPNGFDPRPRKKASGPTAVTQKPVINLSIHSRIFRLIKEVKVGADEEKTHWFVQYPEPNQSMSRPMNLGYDPSKDKDVIYVLKYHKLENDKEVVYVQTNIGPWYLQSEDGKSQKEMPRDFSPR